MINESIGTKITKKETFFPLICPTCEKIPNISHKISNNEVEIMIKCSCSKEPITFRFDNFFCKVKNLSIPKHMCTNLLSHSNKEATKFCIQCDKWICEQCLPSHNTENQKHCFKKNKIEIENFCSFHHEKRAKGIRIDTGNFLCFDCLNTPRPKEENNQIKLLDEIYSNFKFENIKTQFVETQKFYEIKNESLKEKIKEKINHEMDILVSWIDKIEKAYERNANINKQLIFLIDQLFMNYSNFKEKTNYNLIKNLISNTQFHQKPFIHETSLYEEKENLPSLKEKCLELTNYFNSTFIVAQPLHKEKMITLNAHKGFVYSLCKINEQIFASSSSDGSMKFWDVTQNKCINSIENKGEWIYSLCLVDSNKLASGLSDGKINIWNITDIKNQVCMAMLEDHSLSVIKIIKISDNKIASCSYDKTIKIWDMKKTRCINTIKEIGESIASILLLKDGRLVSAGTEKNLKFWNLTTMKCDQVIPKVKCSWVNSLIQLEDGKLVVGDEDKIKIFNVQNYKLEKEIDAKSSWILSIIQLDNGSLILGNDNLIMQWNVLTNQCIQVFEGHKDGVRDIIKMNNKIISCSDDNSIKVWSFSK